MAPCPHSLSPSLTLHCFSAFTLLLLSHSFALICPLGQAWLSHIPTMTPTSPLSFLHPCGLWDVRVCIQGGDKAAPTALWQDGLWGDPSVIHPCQDLVASESTTLLCPLSCLGANARPVHLRVTPPSQAWRAAPCRVSSGRIACSGTQLPQPFWLPRGNGLSGGVAASGQGPIERPRETSG